MFERILTGAEIPVTVSARVIGFACRLLAWVPTMVHLGNFLGERSGVRSVPEAGLSVVKHFGGARGEF